MVEAAGFEIIEQYWFSDYNVFISARKVENPKFPVIANEYEKNQKLFHTYMSNLDDDVKFIESRLNEMTGPKFIFGAHIFTQTLVSRGLNESMFLNVLDNDPTKQGRRLYGTSLKIESPEILRNLKNPIVVVRAAQYTSEIVRGIRQINLKVIII